jgi:glycosyltransferase involved in cell wall biosynthesis
MSKTVFLETHNLNNRASGLGTFNYELIKGFNQIELEDFLLTFNYSDPKELSKEFGRKFNYNHYINITRYKHFRNRNNYDLWHSVNQNTKIEPYNPKNYLLTIHDVNFIEEVSTDLDHVINKRFLKKLERATAITYISEFARKQTHDYFQIAKNIPEYIIHNGNPISSILDISNFKSSVAINKPFFYTIGDFLERKNYHSIVAMMAHIKDFNLIISGNKDRPYGKEIQDLINKNHLQDQVFLTGKVSDEGKQFYLSNCAAFLFPSIREGFGLPPIEAMAFGKPVFLSDKTSLPEIGGKNAYYWTNFDPEYMKDVLLNGLTHFETNKTEMEQLMRTRAASFNWKIAASKYLDVYKKTIG